jgi:hypothetical protein
VGVSCQVEPHNPHFHFSLFLALLLCYFLFPYSSLLLYIQYIIIAPIISTMTIENKDEEENEEQKLFSVSVQ